MSCCGCCDCRVLSCGTHYGRFHPVDTHLNETVNQAIQGIAGERLHCLLRRHTSSQDPGKGIGCITCERVKASGQQLITQALVTENLPLCSDARLFILRVSCSTQCHGVLVSNEPLLLVCLDKRELPGVLVSQLLNWVNSADRFLLWRYGLISTDFRKVGLVGRFQPFRCLIELLLTDFLRSQRRIQILNILFVTGVLSRFREKLLCCSFSLNGVGSVPFFSCILTSQSYLLFGGTFSKRLLRSQDGLLAAQSRRFQIAGFVL